MSAGFTGTVSAISNLCSGQRRSQGLRGLHIVAFDCEEYLSILVGFLPGARRAIVCILFSLEERRVVD